MPMLVLLLQRMLYVCIPSFHPTILQFNYHSTPSSSDVPIHPSELLLKERNAWRVRSPIWDQILRESTCKSVRIRISFHQSGGSCFISIFNSLTFDSSRYYRSKQTNTTRHFDHKHTEFNRCRAQIMYTLSLLYHKLFKSIYFINLFKNT